MRAGKLALLALCTSALTGLSQASQAAVVFNITGGPDNSFTYGTATGANNVINFGGATSTGSHVVDPGVAPSTWIGSTSSINSVVSVTGLAANQSYLITWTYFGSESDNQVRFTVQNTANVFPFPGGNTAITTTDDNRNNSCVTCQPGHVNPAPTVNGNMGATSYRNDGTAQIPSFTLTDVQTGTAVTNGGANGVSGTGIANLIFSYANFDGTNYTLTTTATDFVVFGFNDNGGADADHDDFMGVMSLTPATCDPGPNGGCGSNVTPIPGAAPLFATGVGALGLLVRRRWRRQSV
jgi:hypothetical protein